MKQKHNGGFSLIEVLVSIVLLAAVVVPTCSALVLSQRLNAETDKLMKAQLAVSSAVETLMAEGISVDSVNNTDNFTNRFEDVSVVAEKDNGSGLYYKVTVSYKETDDAGVEKELVSVTTTIRAKGGS